MGVVAREAESVQNTHTLRDVAREGNGADAKSGEPARTRSLGQFELRRGLPLLLQLHVALGLHHRGEQQHCASAGSQQGCSGAPHSECVRTRVA